MDLEDTLRSDELDTLRSDELTKELEPMVRTVAGSLHKTVAPERRAPQDAVRRVLEQLSGLDGESGLTASGRVTVGERLAEGGMGVVHQATQVALHRSVAVKTLRPDRSDDTALLKIVQEAWVTGSLEHPNVVPVHDVGLDSEGRPLIVLKRIEGTSWSNFIRDEAAVRQRFGDEDPLEWNLGVLIQVCNAIHYAHSHGVLHRDIKPDNVMIGAFGEVYVVDWGLAVLLRDDGTARLPLACQQRELAGTPCYMAPEMLGGDPPRLSERTDVYLLGSTLYELVTARPPHEGPNAWSVIQKVARGEPEIPEDVPADLARITRRAMARHPADRFGSAQELRLALQDFLRHRGSARLAEEAQARLDELVRAAGRPDGGDPDARMSLYNLFSECRFGFGVALRSWPDNEPARDGLRRATEIMIDHELASGAPHAAASLVAQLDDPPAELRRRIEAALVLSERERQETEALARLGRAHDQRIGQRARLGLAVAFGALWTLVPLARHLWVSQHGALSWTSMFAWPVVSGTVALGVIVWGRRKLMSTTLNRLVVGAVLLGTWGQLIVHGGSFLAGMDPHQSQMLQFLLWTGIGFIATIAIEWRLLPCASALAAGYLLVSARPDWLYPTMGVTNLAIAVNAIFVWRPGRR